VLIFYDELIGGLSSVAGAGEDERVSMQPEPWPEPDPQVAAAIKAIYRRKALPLAVQVRDMLGEVFADDLFLELFGVRGKPGYSPGRLMLVSVLQAAERLSDRQAAEAAGRDLAWKYALGLALDDPGFDFSVLSEFRTRVVAGGAEQLALDVLLAALADKGLVKAGGRQRTDSTHVISVVRDLNRLELAGESVRAAVEAIVAVAPGWFQEVFAVSGWSARYGRRIDSWRLPTAQTKRDQLAVDYGTDGLALVEAVYSPAAPVWLRELVPVQTLRLVLLQNFLVALDERGKQVIRMRDADSDGLPPAPSRVASPYDTDTRWAAKGDDLFWNGYKVHISETCDTPPADAPGASRRLDRPNIITGVATTDATVPDAAVVDQVHADLAGRRLAPGEHLVDSGYASADGVLAARGAGIDLVTPLLADTSAQARAGLGYDRASFVFDFDARTATCPQGHTSATWNPVVCDGKPKVVVSFATADCLPCPVRQACTTSKASRRQLTVPPREVHQLQTIARAEQQTNDWQARYAVRAGVEGTINQAVDLGIRRARYRGIDKTRLQHVLVGCAINLIRLDAYWNGHMLDRTRTSHLGRLEHALAA
jgi:transposase